MRRYDTVLVIAEVPEWMKSELLHFESGAERRWRPVNRRHDWRECYDTNPQDSLYRRGGEVVERD